MSVEFRQRSVGEILGMFRRRVWFIILPTLAVGLAVAWVVWKLPNVYESRSVLTVKPPTIAASVVRPLTEEDLSQRLTTLNQEVMSRSTLEPMITKYNLYQNERIAGFPMELLIDKMRKAIVLEPQKNDKEEVAAFSIAYRDREPQAARAVTAELASKFVNEQMKNQLDMSEATKNFLNERLSQSKTELDNIEKERLDIMSQNIDTLPDSSQALVAQLAGLHQKRDSLAKEKDSLISERGRLNDNLQSTNRQSQLLEDFGQNDAQEAAKLSGDVYKSQAYAEMAKKKAELEAKLKNQLQEYRDKHPLVLATKNEISEVNAQIETLKVASQENAKDAKVGVARKTELQRKSLDIEKSRIESQLLRNERDIQQKDIEIAQTGAQIGGMESRINTIPGVRVALEGVNNRYQTSKSNYEELVKKMQDAESQVQVENNAQGETIQVVDAANLPQYPVAPKKGMLTALGAIIGLVFGLFLAGIFEIPRLFRVQNLDDAKHYTGLPVLAVIPPLLTHREMAWQRRTGHVRVLVGVAMATAAVPVLIFILQFSKVFDRMVS
ncbi:MAG TPA: GNVR domain-containing protein [Pyrinomonadaceae bacterium]|jgi:polysaccharide chain length determinant protein (PEP-CTERM system associated)|nr:GNVR domain-containing protein [Pyrinomonadaceae bacterium]